MVNFIVGCRNLCALMHSLHVNSKRGEVPCLFGPVVHGLAPNDLLQFEYLEIAAAATGKKCALILRDNHFSYCWLFAISDSLAENATRATSTGRPPSASQKVWCLTGLPISRRRHCVLSRKACASLITLLFQIRPGAMVLKCDQASNCSAYSVQSCRKSVCVLKNDQTYSHLFRVPSTTLLFRSAKTFPQSRRRPV